MTTMTIREAHREAIRAALRDDDRVVLMGEDVGAYGGCFAVTMGLLDEFGPDRVRDTPLSESVITGVCRCGTPLYPVSSTILGSIISMRTSSGVRVNKNVVMMVFMQTLLPAPVAPAISTWGMRARS